MLEERVERKAVYHEAAMLAAVAILVEKTLRSQKVAVASECHFRRGLLHPRSDLLVVMAWLDFRARPLSEIVITIELVLSDFYSPLGCHPNQPVFGNRGFHGGLEPSSITRLGVVHRSDNRSQQRRLRARQIVSSIGVGNFSVSLDLINQVVCQAAGKIGPVILQQTEHDEIAVPV